MTTTRTTARRTWCWANAALGGVLVLAVGGCCVSINLGAPAGWATAPAALQQGPPAGGNFVPVQAAVASGSSAPICGNPVSGKYIRFYPPTQTPNPGDTGFRGYLWNHSTGVVIPNNQYYLQWFVNVQNTGCCAPVGGSSTDVTCAATPGLAYRFTAHFKSGFAPPGGTLITLQGTWTH